MNKKGVEINMNVLIIAAIGLLVLVVLSVIFLGRTNQFKPPFNPKTDICTSHIFYADENLKKCSEWRPKTINDTSCQELKIEILKNQCYFSLENKFRECSPFNEDMIRINKLVDIAIERNCTI